MLKYFALVGASVSALELFGNQTVWTGGADSANGAILTFNSADINFQNGTGECVFSSNNDISSINVGSLFLMPNGGENSFTLKNMRAAMGDTMSFTIFGNEGEEAWEDLADNFSVSCDGDVDMADGDMVMGSFPSHPSGALNGVGNISAKGGVWGDFIMVWPSNANVTFFDQRVTATTNDDVNFVVSASTVESEDLWFQYQTEALKGSYEIGLSPVEE